MPSSQLPFPILALCIYAVCSAGSYSAETRINELHDSERRSGWTLLFDGKTIENWRNYRRPTVSDGWVVKDGAISREMDGAGDIITKEQYDNFELSLEYRISPGGNSGIMFHVTEEESQPWQTGPEVQVQDNQLGHDPQKSGWLYQLYRPVNPDWQLKFEKAAGRAAPEVVDATRPAGEWNHVYLRVASQGEVVVNGIHYCYFAKGSDDWNERVAKSKFAQYAEFGKATQGHICLQDHGNPVSFRNIKIRPLAADGTAPDPVDGQLALKGVSAFPDLNWENWEPVDERGRIQRLRPLELTHAADGGNRIFVAMQSGQIYVFPNDPQAKQATMFLDLRSKVVDWSQDFVANEEGLLGLAFHPNYKSNGEFFVYYISQDPPHTSVISRFRASPLDPDRADPQSEEVLMRIAQPFQNHNGGSIVFGPDGHLYIGMGDGGHRNDLLGNGQNLETWLGKILRIDVNRKENGRNYAIPADNPFRDRPNAQPEIYAYGFRNIWRMSFDRRTGHLWAADVGQDLWEEVNIVRRGSNYGWGIREGTHPFGNRRIEIADPPQDPIWEYDHQIGKSVTGGLVYRGSRLPELFGMYLYADFVSGKIWALAYDEAAARVVRNMSIPSAGAVVFAFGEDEQREAYYLSESANGRGIYRFERVGGR